MRDGVFNGVILAAFVAVSLRGGLGISHAQAQRRVAHPDAEFTKFFQRTNGWVAGDGAISIPISSNRVLWVFGDSHLDDLDPRNGTMACLFQCRNAGLVSRLDLSETRTLAGSGPGFRSWLKVSTNADEWAWPMCGFQEGASVYVYVAAMKRAGTGGALDFKSTGQDYWARLDAGDLRVVSFIPLQKFGDFSFGNGFERSGAYIYAFAGKQKGLSARVFVGRFKPTDLDKPWAFWDGRGWQSDVNRLQEVARTPSTSVHVCKVKDTFVISSSDFSLACDQGRGISVLTARTATGPFSKPRKVYEIPDRYQGHSPFFYFPILHPEFVNSSNEILLTYSINNYEPCVTACSNGTAIPDNYRPKAARVRLEVILQK